MKEILVSKIHGQILTENSPAPLLDVCAGYNQRGLLGESGMIRTQMGKHNRSVMVAVYGTPCVIPPGNSNSEQILFLLIDSAMTTIM
jgi:hypothetical protein